MSFLEIIQAAARLLGISVPSSAVGSSDTDTLQLLELLNQEGRDLSARYGWEVLMREVTFTTVATESQGTLASIISTNDSGHDIRYIVNDTIWNRTQRWAVLGPRAPRVWQAYKALSFSGPFSQYRIRGGSLLFNPAPSAGDTCVFEYLDKRWLTNSGGTTYYREVNADTDVPLLSDEIMLAGLRWRWRAAKKLDYSEEFNTYERMVLDAEVRDGTKKTLNLEHWGDRIDNDIPTIQGGVGSSGAGGFWQPPGF